MKVVILAGGYGTRLSEETHVLPKPMLEIGDRPMLWHIMKIYAAYGFSEFIVLLGYKGYIIKEYFANYFLHQTDVTIDLKTNTVSIHNNMSEPWKITLIDTGMDTMTGGRIKKAASYLDDTFMVTYGDGVADINIADLLAFHKRQGKLMTITAVQPEGRFGALTIVENDVEKFMEKPDGDGGWINGGFFVCEPEIIDYIEDDMTILEDKPLAVLAKEKQLVAYKHHGFWKCMDTARDKMQLNALWLNQKAKWKVW